MAKISNLIIGIIILFMVFGSFGLWITGLVNQQISEINLTSEQNETFQTYQKLNELNATLTSFRDKTDLEGDTNPADQIGRLLSQGFEGMKIAIQAQGLAVEVINQAGEDVPMLSTARPIFILGGTALLLVMILFILISTLTKREQ